MLGDDFVLTHETCFTSRRVAWSSSKPSAKTGQAHGGHTTVYGNNKTSSLECFYCHKMGHRAAESDVLKCK